MSNVTTTLLSEGGAARVRELLAGWPDEQEQADERKPEVYWSYFDRKRKAFNGTFAFGVKSATGADSPSYLAVTFDEAGVASAVRVVDEATVLAEAKLAILAKYDDWASIVDGYDIGKAMTYHMLPLRVGNSLEMLRYAYFVHELIVVFTRVAENKVPA